jgi:hypothetical protein
MARAVDGVITGWDDASRQFRTSDVTVKGFRLKADAGEEISVPEMKMQSATWRVLGSGARGRFYLASGRGLKPTVYGVRLADGTQAFDGNTGFDMWLVAGMYLVLGIAFFWTIIGLVVAWLGWKIVRQMRDAKAAQALFEADAARS